MSIHVECPHCKARNAAPATLGGKTARCSNCGLKLQVPIPEARIISNIPSIPIADPPIATSQEINTGTAEPDRLVTPELSVVDRPLPRRDKQSTRTFSRALLYLVSTGAVVYAGHTFVQRQLDQLASKQAEQPVASEPTPPGHELSSSKADVPAEPLAQREPTTASPAEDPTSVKGKVSRQPTDKPESTVTGHGNAFDLLEADAVETTVVDGLLVYNWTLKIANRTPKPLKLSAFVRLVDKNESPIGRSAESWSNLSASETREVTGVIEIDPERRNDVDAVRANVRVLP